MTYSRFECARCGAPVTFVSCTRHPERGHLDRARHCEKCGQRFHTIEITTERYEYLRSLESAFKKATAATAQ